MDGPEQKDSTPLNNAASFPSTTAIKAEPGNNNPQPDKFRNRPNLIVLDDSDDDSASVPTSQGAIRAAQTTIKSEPSESAPKFQNVPRKRNQDKDQSATRRVRLDSEVILPSIETDAELLRLKEEVEMKDEELAAAQRVAELIRERNETKAKIAALEARSSATATLGKFSTS